MSTSPESKPAGESKAAGQAAQGEAVSGHGVSGHWTVTGVAVLLAVLGGVTILALGFGRDRPGWTTAVRFAATVVGVSSIGGWLLGRLPTRTAAGGVAVALAGTAARIMLPLATLGWLAAKNPSREEGFGAGVLVVFFLVLLATTLLLTMIEQWSSREKTRPD
jgi:hypothetical protein